MDAIARLRLFLEQRRELGETELVLDTLPVEDVLALLGASASPHAESDAPRTTARSTPGQAPERTPERAPQSAADRAATPPVARSAEAPRADDAEREVESEIERSAEPAPLPPPPPPPPRFGGERPAPSDWREALRADDAAAAAPSPAAADRARPADAAPSAVPAAAARDAFPAWIAPLDVTTGIVVPPPPSALFADTPAWGTLDEIAQAAGACTRCALHATARQSVPGEGRTDADFVCVGEAPGQTEDETGRPFVGAAGQLLDKILGAIGFARNDVFICNVLKHRPPGNRNPLPDEVHACRPFLHRQLALVQPKVILALGTFAAQTLLETTLGIGKLRGQVHLYHGVPLVVTYHPAALLRNAAWKRPTWDDVQLARRIHDAAREAAA